MGLQPLPRAPLQGAEGAARRPQRLPGLQPDPCSAILKRPILRQSVSTSSQHFLPFKMRGIERVLDLASVHPKFPAFFEKLRKQHRPKRSDILILINLPCRCQGKISRRVAGNTAGRSMRLKQRDTAPGLAGSGCCIKLTKKWVKNCYRYFLNPFSGGAGK
jgi:hypothetical protein